ncbi:MAG: hypothetical protein V1789_06525 [PVC group bacterium]
MSKLRSGMIFFVCILAGLIVTSCQKQQPQSAQRFLRLVPADTFLYLGFKDWKVLRDETGTFDFVKTARRLRLGPRIEKLLEPVSAVPPGGRETGSRLLELREKVSLWELLGGEIALCGFPVARDEPPVLALLCRLPAGGEALHTDYFQEMLSRAGFSEDELAGTESVYLGEKVITFSLPGFFPGRLARCTAGDTFLLATGAEGAKLILSRLKGAGGGKTLADAPPFRERFRGLDPAAKTVVYLDVAALVDHARGPFKDLLGKQNVLPPEAKESAEALYCLGGLMRVLGTVSAVAGAGDLDENGYRETVRYYLDEKNGSRALLDLVKMPPRDWDVLDYIPEGVADLSADYLSPEKLYRPLLGFIADDPVRGGEFSEIWKKLQESAGISVDDDVLSWLGDEFAVCTVSLSRSFFEPGSFALLCKVTSEKKLGSFLDKLLSLGMGRSLNIVIEEYGGSTLRILYPPIPLFPFNPTIGRVGEYLVLASRKDGFTDIVDTYLRDKKNIRQNPEFIRMRKRLGGEGSGIHFSRLEDKIDSLITFFRSSASMAGMFLPPPSDPAAGTEAFPVPDSREVIDLINDLTRVMADLKVFRFWGGISRYRDGYIEINEFVEIK